MPLVTQKVDLKNSFQYTNLDLEDNGPTSVPNYGHQQNFTPTDGYQDADLGGKGIGLFNENNSLAGNLDIENNPPIPASTGKNGGTFTQKYSPNGQFINSPEGDVNSEKLENKLNTSTSNNTGFSKSKRSNFISYRWGTTIICFFFFRFRKSITKWRA